MLYIYISVVTEGVDCNIWYFNTEKPAQHPLMQGSFLLC